MSPYNENTLNEKLTNHSKIKLSASLFMFLDNIRAIATDQNPFESYETPKEFKDITTQLITLGAEIKPILGKSVDERLEVTKELTAMKTNLLEICESFYCYLSLNNLLSEIMVECRRLKMIENEQETAIDFHGFLHDCTDYITKDEEMVKQRHSTGLLMKCFPLFMTKQKYNDYIEKSYALICHGESEQYALNLTKALEFLFLPTNIAGYGQYFPQLSDYYNTMLYLDFDKLSAEDLEELTQGLDDNYETLEMISDKLSLVYESLNFLTLVITFVSDLDYWFDDDIVRKDAFYYVIENIKTNPDSLLEETVDDLFDGICSSLIDEIIRDEKEGFLDIEPEDTIGYSDATLDMIKVASLITDVYYEMLSELVYNPSHGALVNSAPAEAAFIKENGNKLIDYINTSVTALPVKMQKRIKQLFFANLPSSFTPEEFMAYGNYVLENTMSYAKKIRVLDAVGIVFESTGFMGSMNDNHEHHHGDDCDCGHDHHHHH